MFVHHLYSDRAPDYFNKPKPRSPPAPPDGRLKPANSEATSPKHIRCSVRSNAAVHLSRLWDDVL
jgi:hypothetical protein